MAADKSTDAKVSSAVTTVKKNNTLTIPSKVTSTKHKRAASTAQKSKTSTFVSKLWSMINDPVNNEYIHWMPDGQSFQVTGREQFEAKILPKYFKHKNFSSFVRQLNMYGWHKVQDISSGTMNNTEEKWQFQSPNFIRGREDLLENIQRNKGSKESDDEEEVDLHRVLEELQNIKKNQISLGQDLMRIREDNRLLWTEHLKSQERYKKQAETLDKIVRFLASLYGNQTKLLSDILNPSAGHHTAIGDRNPLLLMPATNEPSSSAGSDVFGAANGLVAPLDIAGSYQVPTPADAGGSGISTTTTDGQPGRITVLNSPRLVDIDDDIDAQDQDLANSIIPKTRSRSSLSRPSPPTTATTNNTEALTPRGLSKSSVSSSSDNSGLIVPATPRNLFPELDTLPPPDNDTTSKLLESNNDLVAALAKEFDSQDMSIEQVQHWIEQMTPGYNRNLDDYDLPPLTTTATTTNTRATAGSPGVPTNLATEPPSPGDGSSTFDVNEFLTDMGGPNDAPEVSVPIGKEVSPPVNFDDNHNSVNDDKPSKRRRTRT